MIAVSAKTMPATRQTMDYRRRSTVRRSAPHVTWFRLRTREWDFFVCSEVEAFAVISRHDVLDVERIG